METLLHVLRVQRCSKAWRKTPGGVGRALPVFVLIRSVLLTPPGEKRPLQIQNTSGCKCKTLLVMSRGLLSGQICGFGYLWVLESARIPGTELPWVPRTKCTSKNKTKKLKNNQCCFKKKDEVLCAREDQLCWQSNLFLSSAHGLPTSVCALLPLYLEKYNY